MKPANGVRQYRVPRPRRHSSVSFISSSPGISIAYFPTGIRHRSTVCCMQYDSYLLLLKYTRIYRVPITPFGLLECIRYPCSYKPYCTWRIGVSHTSRLLNPQYYPFLDYDAFISHQFTVNTIHLLNSQLSRYLLCLILIIYTYIST